MRTCILGLAAVAVLGLAAAVWADETKVPLDKVPKAVKDTVKHRFPKAELTEAATEMENGKTVFEVSIKAEGTTMDVTLSAEGKLLGIEKIIPVKSLPKVVAAGIEAKYPKCKVEQAEEVIKVTDGQEKLEYYEVIVTTADKKKFEAEVTPDGTVKKEEAKKDEAK